MKTTRISYIAFPGLLSDISFAAQIWGISETDMMTSGEFKAVEARYAVMMYRMKTLGHTTAKAAATFRLNHSSAVYAKKKVNQFIQVDKQFTARFDKFKTIFPIN